MTSIFKNKGIIGQMCMKEALYNCNALYHWWWNSRKAAKHSKGDGI